MSATKTFGDAIGAFAGAAGAYGKHVAVNTASYTGRFGAELVTGAQRGYTEKNAELLERRNARRAGGISAAGQAAIAARAA